MDKQQRFERLSEVVRNIPPKHFDMEYWGATRTYSRICCTVACALGHAALDPVFQDQGLMMVYTQGYPTVGPIIVKSIAHLDELAQMYGPIGNSNIQIRYRENLDEVAASAFFGISLEDARAIFLPVRYVRVGREGKGSIAKRAVLRHIKEIARGETPQ